MSKSNKKSRKLTGPVRIKTNAHYLIRYKYMTADLINKIISNPEKFPAWMQRKAFAINHLAR